MGVSGGLAEEAAMSQLHRDVKHCRAVAARQGLFAFQRHKEQKGNPSSLGRGILAEGLPGCGWGAVSCKGV